MSNKVHVPPGYNLSKRIETLNLPVRVTNIFLRQELTTVGDILDLRLGAAGNRYYPDLPSALLDMRHVGKMSAAQILDALSREGITLWDDMGTNPENGERDGNTGRQEACTQSGAERVIQP